MNKSNQLSAQQQRKKRTPGRSSRTRTDHMMIRPPSTISYIDVAFGVGVGSSQFDTNLLYGLCNGSGLFRTYPQANRITVQNGSPQYFKNIRITKLQLHLNFVGSQSSTLASGDLYNRVRLVVWYTDYPYSASTLPSYTVDNMTDFRYVQQVLLDQVINLPSQAFDTATNYNVPQCVTVDKMLTVMKRFECYSSTGLAFDTRKGVIYCTLVSDSFVAPAPSVTGNIRVFYRELDQ